MSRFVALLLILAACEPPPPPVPGEMERTGTVLKVVNGQNVTQGMVDARLAQLPANVRDQVLAKGQTAQVEEELVVGELLYQEALKQKLHERPEIKSSIALSARNALANAVLEDAIKARTTDEAVKTWYNDHLVQFKRPQMKGRLILVKDEAEAKAILVELKGGADFATVAAAKSAHKASAKEGGELGWFETARMGPELSAALADAKAGDLVGPVVSANGAQIILVEERRDAVPIEEVSDKIKTQLRQEIAESYVEEIKKGATISAPGGAAEPGATVAPAAVQTEGTGAAPAAPTGK